MHSAIEVNNLAKVYPNASEYSLQDIHFKIKNGVKLGIFGPNGAGKTTLISLLCGIISPSGGEINYFHNETSIPLKSILYKIGYVPQDFSFYEELSPKENLLYFGTLYEIPKDLLKKKIDSLLKSLGLSKVEDRKIRTFSGGMKRRVNLAIGMINDPDLLFLDEPTVGVDVQSKNAIMKYLEDLNSSGTTIIYTSHHMNEGEEFCDEILLLDRGKMIAHDSLNGLLKQHNAPSLESLFLRLTGEQYRD